MADWPENCRALIRKFTLIG